MSVASTGSPLQTVRVIAADIKLAHSVFAMPFALLAAFMAAVEPTFGVHQLDWSRIGKQLALIVLAMFFARTCAMIANRILDHRIDQRNPRTASRALPSGRVPISAMVTGLIASALLFMLVCSAFGMLFGNRWPLVLGPFILMWICAYGIFKRFTSLCHIYLGSSLALSPIAAAIAINPQSLVEQPALWLLAAMVLCWVAGFDIIYALQDVEIDRRDALRSIPARFGTHTALWISRLLHALAVACLVGVVLIDERLHLWFGAGIVIVSGLLVYEHLSVHRWGTSRIALAFFTLNGLVSCVLGVLGIVDVLM